MLQSAAGEPKNYFVAKSRVDLFVILVFFVAIPLDPLVVAVSAF
jgi:hypothetical protein